MFDKVIMITGGAGFIGSHLVRYFVNKYPNYQIIVFDALTYCGNLENLKDVEGKKNYIFVKGDIRDDSQIRQIFHTHNITDIIHMAAESHVDRSMTNPNIFAETNILGTINLLNIAKEQWPLFSNDISDHMFFNMCTDEIFGALSKDDKPFTEVTPLNPHSPYSTSKTAQYMYGKTYYEAYGVPVVSLACGNAIGPNQFPEKLVPLTIDRLINKEKIPVYGKGEQMRDWTHVSDICKAIDLVFHKGKYGELYCIGGDACTKNIDVINKIILEVSMWETEEKYVPKNADTDMAYASAIDGVITENTNLIEYIPDPRGKSHDFRYDLDHTKITNELGWKPEYTLERSIKETVEWYLNNKEWTEHCKSGEYKNWIKTYYGK